MRTALGPAPAGAPPRHAFASYGAWVVAWFGMVVLALLNGTLRAVVVQPVVGETIARFVATLVLLALVTSYVWWLLGRRPLAGTGLALAVGATWTALTLAFEFSFGRFVEHLSWSTMLADYDLTRARIWVLVPLWLVLAPAVLSAVRRERNPR